MPEKAFIDIRSLTKWYKNAQEPAIDQIDLQIGKGEIFGLLGPNGAGKTTTISILCDQIQATSGNIFINGKNQETEKEEIKKIIGVVPQDIALFSKLTAAENLQFFGKMYGLNGKLLKQRIEESLLEFRLIEKKNKLVNTFSGGMKRRINLIAGLLHKPQILFLDEPTVGIDVQSKTVIIEYLKSLNKNEGTSIVYTSHMMDEAENLCSSIAILDKGKIITQGKTSELTSRFPGSDKLEDIFLILTGKNLRD
ncbi:MAG TPA: ABC transporter ATP-binding protein [Bacteroidales bacterium]